MKVSKAIQWLSEYDPDEQIVILWWDRETLDDEYLNTTNEQMELADEVVRDTEYIQSLIAEIIVNTIDKNREETDNA